MKIEIISREAIKPSFPTPSHLKTFPLSLIDQPIPQTLYIPIVLYYPHNTNFTQFQVSNVLKTSLSNTLNLYYPLAGKMKGGAYVDCNDQGVNYLEAQLDCPLSDIVESPCVKVLSELIPSMTNETEEGAIEAQLSIQCNLFNCGGVAIGILFSHRIGDACTLASFLQTWAKTAKGEKNLMNPSFDSSSIFPSRDPSEFTTGGGMVPKNDFVTKRFVFSGQKIAAFLEKVSVLAPKLSKPTRVELVTSLIWKCGMNANKSKGYTSSVATLPVNLRPRMDPPLPESSFGNIFRTAFGYGDFETELDTLIEILRKSIGVFDGDGIKRFQSDGYRVIMETREKVKEMICSKEVLWLKFGVWCRFSFYKVDFGWGKPVWVSCGKTGSKNQTILLDTRCGSGIEAWVTMEEEDMKAFEQDPKLLAFASLS